MLQSKQKPAYLVHTFSFITLMLYNFCLKDTQDSPLATGLVELTSLYQC